MNYKVFTRHLRNLNDNRKALSDLAFELDNIMYDLQGVKGISYDEHHSSTNLALKEEKKLEMIEKYNRKVAEYDSTKDQINMVEGILTRMPEELQTMLNEVYIQNMTFRSVGLRHNYSDHGLWKMLKRETEKYL